MGPQAGRGGVLAAWHNTGMYTLLLSFGKYTFWQVLALLSEVKEAVRVDTDKVDMIEVYIGIVVV